MSSELCVKVGTLREYYWARQQNQQPISTTAIDMMSTKRWYYSPFRNFCLGELDCLESMSNGELSNGSHDFSIPSHGKIDGAQLHNEFDCNYVCSSFGFPQPVALCTLI
jgi:hypothetical protein